MGEAAAAVASSSSSMVLRHVFACVPRGRGPQAQIIGLLGPDNGYSSDEGRGMEDPDTVLPFDAIT